MSLEHSTIVKEKALVRVYCDAGCCLAWNCCVGCTCVWCEERNTVHGALVLLMSLEVFEGGCGSLWFKGAMMVVWRKALVWAVRVFSK